VGLGLLFLRLGWSVHGSKKAHVIWPKVSTSNISLWLRSWGVIVIINTINYNIFKHKSRFCDQGQHQITFLSQQRTWSTAQHSLHILPPKLNSMTISHPQITYLHLLGRHSQSFLPQSFLNIQNRNTPTVPACLWWPTPIYDFTIFSTRKVNHVRTLSLHYPSPNPNPKPMFHRQSMPTWALNSSNRSLNTT